jgi:hypothetical protein
LSLILRFVILINGSQKKESICALQYVLLLINLIFENLMNTLNECPCCSEPLLRHARHGGVYWFCPHCRQEMPNLLSALAADRKPAKQLEHVGV